MMIDLPLALVVERHVRVEVGVRDQPVIGDHRHVLLVGLLDDAGGRLDVDGVKRERIGPVGQRGLGLGLLLLRILRGVRVDHLAARAVALDLGLELGPVVGLVARGLGLGQEQGDRLALGLAAAGAARRLLVAAARGQPDDREKRHRCRDESPESSLHRLPPQWVAVIFESPAGASGSSPSASASSSASCWARTTAGMTASASGTASGTGSRATGARPPRAGGRECSRAGPGASRWTAAIGPWRKSAAEMPSATMRAVSLIFSAASSAAAWRSPRATTNSRSAPARRSASARGSAGSASSAPTSSGSAASSPAANGAGPSAAATAATASSWAVTVLVAGTARSIPASMAIGTSATVASGLAGSLTIATVRAPADRRRSHTVKTWGVALHWLRATNSR